MLKALASVIFTDLKWKLLAVIVASGLWFVGMNVTNPMRNQVFTCRLDLSNLDSLRVNQVVVLNESDLMTREIEITMRGTRAELDALTVNNINVYLDVKSIDTRRVTQSDEIIIVSAEVMVEAPFGYEPIGRWPNTVDMELDRHINKSFPVQLYPIGEAAEGFVIRDVSSDINFVRVSGAKSYVDEVRMVYAQTNTQNINADSERIEPVRAYDDDGIDITNTVTLGVEAVHIKIEVLPYKFIDLDPVFSGRPAAGYSFINPVISPERVRIVGPQTLIRTINRISLDNVSLNNASETFSRDFDIVRMLPDGVFLHDDDQNVATVTFNIEPNETRAFFFPVDRIIFTNLPANATAGFAEIEPLQLNVRGASSFINAFSIENEGVAVEVNLQGLEAGEHSVTPVLRLPRGFDHEGELPQLNIIIEIENSAEENDSED